MTSLTLFAHISLREEGVDAVRFVEPNLEKFLDYSVEEVPTDASNEER